MKNFLTSLFGSPKIETNNFDLLRLLFALTVCLCHIRDLSGNAVIEGLFHVLSSEIAVKGFFILSGFLIFMSYERSKSLKDYAIKRFRRIYPAYATIVILCAFGLFAFSTYSATDYFNTSWLKYLVSNLIFLNFSQHTLPGVFLENKMTAVNGALWTLKIEVMFYMCVPIFAYLFKKYNRLIVLIVVYIASLAYSQFCFEMEKRTGAIFWQILARQLIGQLCYFVSGAFFYYYRAHFIQKAQIYFIPAFAYNIIAHFYGDIFFIEPFALAILVCFFGLTHYLGNITKYGDFSYSLYIVHFPVIQLLLQTHLFDSSPYGLVATVLALVGLLAFLMWNGVEKRFLLRSNHYITVS